MNDLNEILEILGTALNQTNPEALSGPVYDASGLLILIHGTILRQKPCSSAQLFSEHITNARQLIGTRGRQLLGRHAPEHSVDILFHAGQSSSSYQV